MTRGFGCLPFHLPGVAGLGGMPEEVMADRELRDLVEPTLRADFAVVETRPLVCPFSLSCPVAAITAEGDCTVDPARVVAWREATRGNSIHIPVSGGHFVVRDDAQAVRVAVSCALRWAGLVGDGASPAKRRKLTLRDIDPLMGA
jgi:medium-chain acyl-[acyl-carrier-protein] hydrolase